LDFRIRTVENPKFFIDRRIGDRRDHIVKSGDYPNNVVIFRTG
jgi:hypothetical protein